MDRLSKETERLEIQTITVLNQLLTIFTQNQTDKQITKVNELRTKASTTLVE